MQESKMQISVKDIRLGFDKKNLRYSISTEKTNWETEGHFSPYFVLHKKTISVKDQANNTGSGETAEELNRIYFHEARELKHELVKSGVGEGIRSSYSGFTIPDFSFETFVWIEYSTKQVYFEWIPLHEAPLECIESVFFPGPFSFKKESKDWYTIIPKEQGILIPNTWDVSFKQDGFNGRFGTASAYLPIFGQVKDGEGYLAESPLHP